MKKAYPLPQDTVSSFSPVSALHLQAVKSSDDYAGPQLTMRLASISHQVSEFRRALPQVKPHFAVKANPLP